MIQRFGLSVNTQRYLDILNSITGQRKTTAVARLYHKDTNNFLNYEITYEGIVFGVIYDKRHRELRSALLTPDQVEEMK